MEATRKPASFRSRSWALAAFDYSENWACLRVCFTSTKVTRRFSRWSWHVNIWGSTCRRYFCRRR